jgi:hypothetical protein
LRQQDNEIEPTLPSNNISDDEEPKQVASKTEIVTEYVIRTKHSINPIDFTSISSTRTSIIMMNSSEFIEIISDIDNATDEIQLVIDERRFLIKTLGVVHCNTQIPFPSNHKIFKTYECHEDTKFSYKFICFKSMLKALANSVEVCLDTRENGLLKVQIMGKASDGSLYYEFSMMPNVTEEDEDIDLQ